MTLGENEKSKMEMMQEEGNHGEQIDPFVQIMEKVGLNGRFQFIYNALFVVCLSYFGGMIYMNIILALNVPDHWCEVPGRNNTNFTLEEWKSITLPR